MKSESRLGRIAIPRPLEWTLAALLAAGCGDSGQAVTGPSGQGGGKTGGAASTSTGGAELGGSPGSGGSDAGGTLSTGGGPVGGMAAGGTTATGGVRTGGAPASGGVATGGNRSGGTAAGGTSTGGTTAGGTASGGTASGGMTSGGTGGGGRSTGGAATGGTPTGGTQAGGAPAGGSPSGGTATGGLSSGGTASGGTSSGGTSAGGTSAGGTSAGGTSTGGTSTSTGGTSGGCANPPAPSALVGWASVSGSGVTTTTGGGNATPTIVTSLSALNSAAGGTAAAVIYVQGSFTGTVTIGSNKTIVGICGAQITGTMRVSGSANVIVRNLKIVGNNCNDSPSDCSGGADAVFISNSAHHIWFDHCDISDGSDGNLDINAASDLITISWTKFHYSSARTDPVAGASGHRFSNLVGSADNVATDVGKLNVTYHHVWWADNVDQRMPRVRYGKIHVFNSLYTATNNNYCIGVGMASNFRVENNVFIGSTRPVNTTSFVDSASVVNSIGNIYTNTTGAVTDIGTAFVPSYSYTLDDAASVESAVRSGAGPH